MPRTPSQHDLARRALVEERVASSGAPAARSRWWQRGAAVVGISVLGIGVAGSGAVTGNAQNTITGGPAPLTTTAVEPSVSVTVVPGVAVPSAFDRRGLPTSRVTVRPALAAAAVSRDVDRPDLQLALSTARSQQTTDERALELRQRSLTKAAKSTDKQNASLKKARAKAKAKAAARAKRAAEAKQATEAKRAAAAKEAAAAKQTATRKARSAVDESSGSGSASLPITSGYHIAARFGDTGSWSRYHTGIDFSVGMGTPVHAVAAGTVTHAGSGSAGWAGHYVTIRHADGKTSLYAHMSTVTVHEGERVSGGQQVGRVGMTGRTFGPHVHFEIYPSGAKVGSPYEAINPAPWLGARGLHF